MNRRGTVSFITSRGEYHSLTRSNVTLLLWHCAASVVLINKVLRLPDTRIIPNDKIQYLLHSLWADLGWETKEDADVIDPGFAARFDAIHANMSRYADRNKVRVAALRQPLESLKTQIYDLCKPLSHYGELAILLPDFEDYHDEW